MPQWDESGEKWDERQGASSEDADIYGDEWLAVNKTLVPPN